jgi:hypothetical protein
MLYWQKTTKCSCHEPWWYQVTSTSVPRWCQLIRANTLPQSSSQLLESTLLSRKKCCHLQWNPKRHGTFIADHITIPHINLRRLSLIAQVLSQVEAFSDDLKSQTCVLNVTWNVLLMWGPKFPLVLRGLLLFPIQPFSFHGTF